MILELLFITGTAISFLALLGYLKPWNTLSLRIGATIVIFTFIGLVAAPATVITPVDNWEVNPCNPDTSGWSTISSVWNKEDNLLIIPLILNGTSSYTETNVRIPFEIKPVQNQPATKDDYTTITIQITNYSNKIHDSYLLKRTKGTFFANITDPSGIGSGDSYKKTYEMKYQDQGTFYIDFQANPGTAALSSLGASSDITIHIYAPNFHRQYTIRFICISD